MKRRTVLFALAAALVLPATAAHADDDMSEDWIEWLDGAGYRDIAVTRTLLGRLQIRAALSQETREIVLNPRTGEVLRDVWIDKDGNTRPSGGPPSTPDDDKHGLDRPSGDGREDNGGHGDD